MKRANLLIPCRSAKQAGVANGGVSTGVNVAILPFPKLLQKTARTDTFNDFPSLLMSMGRVADDNNISIFTKDSVTVHKEQDILIT